MRKQLHPGARWQFRFRGYFGALFLLIFLSWFILPVGGLILALILGGNIGAVIISMFVFVIFYIAAIIVIAEIYARMAYARWFYEFTDSNLKIERGIIWKRYSNLPYERVQNVDIYRGILARMLGFSSVMIQTAGYSMGGYSEGYIPAVSPEEAEQIREFLMKKVGKKSHQGL